VTSEFVLVGARGVTSQQTDVPLVRPGAAELLALYHRVLTGPLGDDHSVEWPLTPWADPDPMDSEEDVLSWLQAYGCRPVCTCVSKGHALSVNGHASAAAQIPGPAQLTLGLDDHAGSLPGPEKGRGARCLLHNPTRRDIRVDAGRLPRVPHLAEIHLTDLRDFHEWQVTLRDRLLLAEVPHALSVLDAALLAEGVGDLLLPSPGYNRAAPRAGRPVSFQDVEPGMPDFSWLTEPLAAIGRTQLFLRPANDIEDGPLVLEARSAGAAIEMNIPVALRSGQGRQLQQAFDHGRQNDEASEPECQVLRLVPLPQPEPLTRVHPWIQRLARPATVNAAFGLVVVAVVAIRFAILNSGDAPPTIDSGNWLSFADSILGHSPRDVSIAYPPLVPLLTELFTSVFGIRSGVAAMGALSSAAPALGLYAALRMGGVGRLGMIPALLLLAAGSVGEAAAWGGFPQLLGMALLPITVILGLRFIDGPSRRTALGVGLGLMLSFATSHFVSAILVFALLGALAVDWLGLKKQPITARHLKLSPLIVLPSVWLISTYAKLVDAVIFNPNEFAALDNLSWGNVLQRLDTLYSEFPELWQILVPLALVTPGLTWYQRRSPVWRLSTSLLVAVLSLLLLTAEGRYLYFVPLTTLSLLGIWILEVAKAPRVVDMERPVRIVYGFLAVTILAAVALQMSAGVSRFDDQRDFYAAMSPGLLVAIETADELVELEPAANRGAIAVPSLNDAPIGWWVEALTEEVVFYGSPLRWLNFGNEIERASAANMVFRPSFPNAESLPLLRASGVSVLVMPRQWAWYDDDSIDQWVEDNALDVVVRNNDALTIDLSR